MLGRNSRVGLFGARKTSTSTPVAGLPLARLRRAGLDIPAGDRDVRSSLAKHPRARASSMMASEKASRSQ